jgi:hypothetical protein
VTSCNCSSRLWDSDVALGRLGQSDPGIRYFDGEVGETRRRNVCGGRLSHFPTRRVLMQGSWRNRVERRVANRVLHEGACMLAG